jgi:5'-methylthioadenosine phosphorylase
MNKLGIIGGSGLYNLQLGVPEKIQVQTPFGSPSSEISKYKLANSEVYFLTRHGEGHRITPSEINYQANIFALKKLGVQSVISISAVGSMRKHIEPGHFVLPDQYIDFTKGSRKNTFF